MTVGKHGCDITRILICYVLLNAHFDWRKHEGVSREYVSIKKLKKPQHFPSFVELFWRNNNNERLLVSQKSHFNQTYFVFACSLYACHVIYQTRGAFHRITEHRAVTSENKRDINP